MAARFLSETLSKRACLLVALVVAATGCNDTGSGGKSEGIVACEALYGSVERGSNASVHRGMLAAKGSLGVELRTFSGTQTDLAPLVQGRGCDVVAATGAPLGDAILQLAKQHPQRSFVIVDRFFDFASADDLVRHNVRIVAYRSDQAAFLAGYLAGEAASASPQHEHGSGSEEIGAAHAQDPGVAAIATFGGTNNAYNRMVMDAFRAGVLAYGEESDVEVGLIGWNGSEGLFTGSDSDVAAARRLSSHLIDRGAGVVFPVAGDASVGAVQAALAAGEGLVIDGGGGSLGRQPHLNKGVLLASIVKRSDVASLDAVRDVVRARFSGGLEVGALSNRGVDLALMSGHARHLPGRVRRKIEELEGDLRRGLVSLEAADYEPTGHESHD
ncbi:BMP family ABC transporter substrate-binding protein [soil metagenome]